MNRKSFLTLLAGLVGASFLPKKKPNPAWETIPYDNQVFHWQVCADKAIESANRDVNELHRKVTLKILARNPWKDILDGGTFEIDPREKAFLTSGFAGVYPIPPKKS